jgi:hypothetical protein
MRVLITGSREASPAMQAKVEEVVLWVKRQGYALLVGDAPGVDARSCTRTVRVIRIVSKTRYDQPVDHYRGGAEACDPTWYLLSS